MNDQLVTCDHTPAADPRLEGSCLKCGRTLPFQMIRSVERERALLERVTDDRQLVDLAHSWVVRRAGLSGWRNLASRDFKREAVEEAVDGIAYCLGQADQRSLHGYEDALSSGQLMALHHFTQALRCLLTPSED